jgi:hypothetical protein
LTETLDLPLPLRIGASANSSADALALLIALGVVARFHQIAADSASSAYQLDPSSGDALMASGLLHAAQHLQLSSNQKLLTPIQFGPEAERTQQNCTNPTSGCSCTDHAAVQAQRLIEWKDISARLAKLAAEGFRRQA